MANMASVFLDRDGVINRKSPDYVKSWGELEILPKVKDAIGYLEKAEGGTPSS